jgi:hypothetical protein
MKTKFLSLFVSILAAATLQAQNTDNIMLKDYRPVSIFKIPVSNIERAAYPIIDAHTHDYAKNDAEIREWIKVMDACGREICHSDSDFRPGIYSICPYSKYSSRLKYGVALTTRLR